MKKVIIFAILVLLVIVTIIYKNVILMAYYEKFYNTRHEVTIGEKNQYYRDYDFMYVQNTNNFKPTNKQDLMNILYTILNAGKDEFTFYCPDEYEGCTDEVSKLAKDQVVLSSINNYVHPFNSFKNISTETDTTGKVTIRFIKTYSKQDIEAITSVVKKLEKELINKNLSIEDQLKVIHDYIIDHTKYDSDRTDNNIIQYKSDTAYGTLIEGYSICGGYSDAFELFLEDLNIKSFKVASDTHIWNAVHLYNTWYNYDLTWDDPVTNTNEQIIDNRFLKLTTPELLQIEQSQHNFDSNIYQEVAPYNKKNY